MKGHTEIILTNVETGEQEIHQDDNLVTAALDKIINIEMAVNNAPNTNILPIATNALGGIMLFDNELTEDINNIHFPVEAHLVAYANQGVNTSDSHRGSYNATESGKTDTGFVSVWDFETSQANGTIRSIARTSQRAGACPINYYLGPRAMPTASGNPTSDGHWYPIRYDGEYLYALKGDSTTHIMRLARTRIPTLKFGVGDYSDVARTYEVIASWNTFVTSVTYWSNSQHTNEYTFNAYADSPVMYEDGHDGFIYCVCYGVRGLSYYDYDYDITYFTVKYDDASYTKSECYKLNTGTSFYSDSGYGNLIYASRLYGHVNNGILYRMSSDRKLIWQIPLANVAAARSTRVINSNTSDYINSLHMTMSHNGALWFSVYHYTTSSFEYRNGVYYPDGEFLVLEVSYNERYEYPDNSSTWLWLQMMTCDDDLTVWAYYNEPAHITRNWAANYLGTINNLQTAITKTAAQTMKIVYTLTDIDEGDESDEDER